MNSRQQNPRRRRTLGRRVLFAVAALMASLCVAPNAFAHSHVRFGISIGAGNCWSCGYRAALPPVYYMPAYPPPAYYYPPTVYYAPRPVYYGYGYYGYYAPRHHYRGSHDRYRGRHYGHGGWHHRGHYYHGHR